MAPESSRPTASKAPARRTGEPAHFPWGSRRMPLYYDFSMSWRRAAVEKLAEAVDYLCQAAVAGDVAEFGTYSGLTAAALARSIRETERFGGAWMKAHEIAPRRLHLFDSFAGFPGVTEAADVDSPSVASGAWAEGRGKGKSPEELIEICSASIDRARIAVHPGFFSESLGRLPQDVRFALVHVDCDLYESTRDVLTDLFENDRWTDGCTLLFDDWNCNRASPHFGERKAWEECVARYQPRFTDCGGYGPVGWQFLLHR